MSARWIDLSEAARRLGHKDSSALRHLIRRHRVPEAALLRIGASWAVDAEWVASHPRRPPA
jgi:hypothetical protein